MNILFVFSALFFTLSSTYDINVNLLHPGCITTQSFEDTFNTAPGEYKQVKKTNSGSGNSADHIPSFAALKKIEEGKLGRKLSALEERTLKQTSLTLSIETQLHQTKSLTYGARNTPARQQQDASNPLAAIKRDVEAYRSSLLDKGYSNEEIDKAILTLSERFTKHK